MRWNARFIVLRYEWCFLVSGVVFDCSARAPMEQAVCLRCGVVSACIE